MTQMNANILKQAKLCILRFPHLFWWETDLEVWKQTMKAADWAELAGHESLINCLHFKRIQIELSELFVLCFVSIWWKTGVWARQDGHEPLLSCSHFITSKSYSQNWTFVCPPFGENRHGSIQTELWAELAGQEPLINCFNWNLITGKEFFPHFRVGFPTFRLLSCLLIETAVTSTNYGNTYTTTLISALLVLLKFGPQSNFITQEKPSRKAIFC